MSRVSRPVAESTRLVLLRHGQTALSVDRRYSGRDDVALTEIGTIAADLVARAVRRAVAG